MAFTDDFTLANDGTFQQKLRMAICKTAVSVAGEASTVLATKDEKRHQLAVAVLVDGGIGKLEAFAFASVAGGALTGASTDTDIETRLSAIWNDLAGVSGRDAGV
jgi:hypothetical protein